MDHIGIRTFWFLVLPVLFKQTNASKHNYVLEGDIDDNMKIVKEIPGKLLTDCVMKCENDARCRTPAIRYNDQGEMTTCLMLDVVGKGTVNGSLVKQKDTKALLKISEEVKYDDDVQEIKDELVNEPKKVAYTEWLLESPKMCFGAKDGSHGEFQATRNGNISGVKLVYIDGKVWCTVHLASRWGCTFDHPDNLGTLVTDEKNNAIFPPLYRHGNDEWYRIENTKANNDTLSLFYPDFAVKVAQGEKLRVFFFEDWRNKNAGDNDGTVCAKVFAKYEYYC